MKRKVNAVGTGTLTVSLPSKWVHRLAVQKGDEVDIQELDGKLVLSKDVQASERSAELSIAEEHPTADSDRVIRSLLGRYYRYGYSRLTVQYKQSVFPFIKAATNELIGADITELGEGMCTIRIFPTNDTEILPRMRKMLLAIKCMLTVLEESPVTETARETLLELRNGNWRMRDYLLRNAYLSTMPYERFGALSTVLHTYEKIGGNLLIFFDATTSKRMTGWTEQLHIVHGMLDRLISFATKPMSYAAESELRNDMSSFNRQLLARSHGRDATTLAMLYFIVESLEGSVSYLSILTEHPTH